VDYNSSEAAKRRDYLITRGQEILKGAETRGDKKGMTEPEEKEFNAAMAEADEITAARRNAAKPGGMSRPDPDADSEWRDTNGNAVRVLKPDQRFADLDPYRDTLHMGKYLRGVATGNWKGADHERRAASEGVLSGGGFMVPTPLSAFLIDRARNAAVCFQAGAIAIPMDSATLKIARVAQTSGDIGTAWMAENAAQADTQATYELVTLTSHVLSAYTKLSLELFEDAQNIDTVVVNQLGKIIALELDRAGLEGSGVGAQPTGIFAQTGVALDTTTFGANGSLISGTTPTGAVAWDWLSKAIFAVRALNEYPTAVVYSERTAGELDLLRASTGVYLPPPPSVANLSKGIFTTNSLSNARTQGTGTTCSNAYVGNFGELIFGIRNGLQFEMSREAADSTSSTFANRQIFIRVYGRYDVAVARPAAFRVVEGIL